MVVKGDIVFASAVSSIAANELLPPETILPLLGVIIAGGFGGAIFAVMSTETTLRIGVRLFASRSLLSIFCSGPAYYLLQGYLGSLSESIPKVLGVMAVSFCMAAHKEVRQTAAEFAGWLRGIRRIPGKE